jgi:hypothetical protein
LAQAAQQPQMATHHNLQLLALLAAVAVAKQRTIAAQMAVQAVEHITMALGRDLLGLAQPMKVLMVRFLQHLAHYLAAVVVVLVKQETPMQKAMAAMALVQTFQVHHLIMLVAVAAELMHKAQLQQEELAAAVMVEVTTH